MYSQSTLLVPIIKTISSSTALGKKSHSVDSIWHDSFRQDGIRQEGIRQDGIRQGASIEI